MAENDERVAGLKKESKNDEPGDNGTPLPESPNMEMTRSLLHNL